MRQDGRDEWETPQQVYDRICTRWNLYPQIDLFCDRANSKCAQGFTAQDGALTVNWIQFGKSGWLQPPYSQPTLTQAIEKAVAQAFQGFETLFLLPARVDQLWYHKWIKHFEHDFWEGRIAFIPPSPNIVPSSPREGSIHGVIRL